MKAIIASIFLLVLALMIPRAKSQSVVAYGSFVVTNTVTTAERLISTNLLCNTVTFYGTRSNTVNSGIVYLGTSTNFTLYPIAVSGEVSISAPKTGEKLNLKNFWFRVASAGDGLLVIFQ